MAQAPEPVRHSPRQATPYALGATARVYGGMQFASPTEPATATPALLRRANAPARQAPAHPLSPLGSPLALLLIGAGGLVLGYDQLGSYRTRPRSTVGACPDAPPNESEAP